VVVIRRSLGIQKSGDVSKTGTDRALFLSVTEGWQSRRAICYHPAKEEEAEK
jgi:hypothetical protein